MNARAQWAAVALVATALSCQCTTGVNQPPDVRIVSPLDGAVLRGGGPFQLVGQVTDPEELIADAHIVWRSDRQGLLGTGATLSTLLNVGPHRLTLEAVDTKGAAGSAQLSVTVLADTVVNTAPVAFIDAPATNAFFDQGVAVTLTGHATDAEDGVLSGTSLGWTSDKAGALGTGSPLTFSNAALGRHRIVLTATDNQGASSVATIELEVVRPGTNRPPVVTIVAPLDGAQTLVGALVMLTGSATDMEDGVLSGPSLVWTSSRDGALGTGASLQKTLTQGVHTLTLTATDSLQAVTSASVTVSVNAPNNQPPTIMITAPATNTTVFAGASVTFTGTGSDAEDGTLTGTALTWSSSRDGALGSGTSLTTTTLTVGAHFVTLVGTDSGGNTGTATVALHVLPQNTAPTVSITAPANHSQITSGTSVTFSATAIDPEDGVLSGTSVRWTSSLGGGLGTGTSLSTAALVTGTHTITVTATDSGGVSASANITLTVTGVVMNLPPTARLTGPTQGQATDGLTFDGSTSSDPDGTIASFSVNFGDGTPVASTATATHAYSTAGTYTVTLVVTDNQGATGTATLIVTIAPFVRVPVVVDGSDENASAACSLGVAGATLCVAWFSSKHPTLWYGRWASGVFTREIIDSLGFNTGGNVNPTVSLVLDGAHAPHVAYAKNGQVFYATKVAGSWLRERVDSATLPAYGLTTAMPSVAVSSTGQVAIAYDTYTSPYTRLVVATRTGTGVWSQAQVSFPLGTVWESHLQGEIVFSASGALLLPVSVYASSTNSYASYLAAWTTSATEVYRLTTAALTTATSLTWAGPSRLLIMGGTGLFDVTLAAPLANSTATMSYLETSSTSQHAVAVTSTSSPRIVVNHGSTLESVWPHPGSTFWDRLDLGATDNGRIDAAVDASDDTRACFFRAGKLVLY
jgi:PKD repeat protein